MPRIPPLQFFRTLYPDWDLPGRLVLWTKSRKFGKKHSDWPYSLIQAARLARGYRHTREVYYGVALHNRDRSLAIARRRRPRMSKRTLRGAEASVTALPALWAKLNVAGPGRDDARLPPDRASALGVLEALIPPSIIVDTGYALEVYWLLRELLLLATEADRRDARNLLRRLQWALEQAATALGWTSAGRRRPARQGPRALRPAPLHLHRRPAGTARRLLPALSSLRPRQRPHRPRSPVPASISIFISIDISVR